MLKVRYRCYKLLFRVLALMPWAMLEIIARGLAVCMHRWLRYRRTVVYANLERSFPKMTPKEREVIAQTFYLHLTYQFLSTPKLLSEPPSVIREQHLMLEGLEVFEQIKLTERNVCIVMMGHCGNWELFSAGQVYFAPLGFQQEQLYRPLKDAALDRVQLEMRAGYGSINTPKGEIGRRLIQLMRGAAERPHILAFIADQTPRETVDKVWTTFLGQPTAFLDGAERLARKFDLPVVYMDIETLALNKYRGRMLLITDSPKALPLGDITRRYAALLERTIKRAPAYWLWSHKRWKLNPPTESPT